MFTFLHTFFAGLRRDERGASAVEYGLLVAGIAAVVILAVFTLGDTVKESFTDTNDTIATAQEERDADTTP